MQHLEQRDAAQYLLDDVTLKIVDTLLDNPTVPFNKSQLADAADVSRDALYRRWDTLVAHSIVEEADVRANGTYWTLNADADAVDALARLLHPQP